MTLDEFDKKWPEATQKTVLAIVLEQGIRSLKDAGGDPQSIGVLQKDAEAMSRDMSELPWMQIRYIVKRRL